VRQAADTEVAPVQRDNVKGGSPHPAPPAEDLTPDPATPPAEPVAATAPDTTDTADTETQTEDQTRG
jgi:hypothetical protein